MPSSGPSDANRMRTTGARPWTSSIAINLSARLRAVSRGSVLKANSKGVVRVVVRRDKSNVPGREDAPKGKIRCVDHAAREAVDLAA